MATNTGTNRAQHPHREGLLRRHQGARARRQGAPEELDDGSNAFDASDDDMQHISENYADDPTYKKLRSFLMAQGDGDLKALMGLTWICRGDCGAQAWGEVLAQVRDVREQHRVDYLLGSPLLGAYLEEALAQFGLSCAALEIGRLQQAAARQRRTSKLPPRSVGSSARHDPDVRGDPTARMQHDRIPGLQALDHLRMQAVAMADRHRACSRMPAPPHAGLPPRSLPGRRRRPRSAASGRPPEPIRHRSRRPWSRPPRRP